MASFFRLDQVGSFKLPDERALLAPVRPTAQRLLIAGVGHLNTVVPVDKGQLRNSLQPDVTLTRVEGGDIPTAITWGTNLPYGGALAEGQRRGPGSAPPVAAIERWIRRKKIAPDAPVSKSKRRPSQAKLIRSLAFAIARKIAKEGTSTGPAYVSGPNAANATAGWFDTLEPVLERALDTELDRLGSQIEGVWNAA